jgi:hypothetical protein
VLENLFENVAATIMVEGGLIHTFNIGEVAGSPGPPLIIHKLLTLLYHIFFVKHGKLISEADNLAVNFNHHFIIAGNLKHELAQLEKGLQRLRQMLLVFDEQFALDKFFLFTKIHLVNFLDCVRVV